MSDFVIHNDDPYIIYARTKMIGFIKVNYEDLVKTFGEPSKEIGVEWVVKWSDASVVRIFSQHIRMVNWWVHGTDQRCLNKLSDALGNRYQYFSENINNLDLKARYKFLRISLNSKCK
jgi:hypothetical protein